MVTSRSQKSCTGSGTIVTLFVTLFAIGLVSAGCSGQEVPRYGLDAGFGAADPPRPLLAGRLVTSNNGDDSLSVIDPRSLGPAVRLPVGLVPVEPEGPHHISASPDGAFVYVNLSYSVVGGGNGPHGAHGNGTLPGFLLKLSTADGRLVSKVGVDANPGENLLTRDGATAYVTHYNLTGWIAGVTQGDLRKGDSNLVAVDTANMDVKWRLPICPAAHGARLAQDEGTLFAACAPDEIAVVDLTAPTPTVRRVPLPGLAEGGGCMRCPYALAVAPDETVWIASLGPSSGRQGGGGIDIYDPRVPGAAGGPAGAFDRGRSITLPGGRAMFPAFRTTVEGYRAYVPQQGPGGDKLLIYDVTPAGGPPTQTGALTFDRSTCENAHVVSIDEAAGMAYLVCEGDHTGPGTLVVVDLDGLSVSRSEPVGVFPDGIVIVPPSSP